MRLRRGIGAIVAALLIAAVLGACTPVVPVVELEESSFEGFRVVSYVPEEPVGIVYLFHGSGGSAAFVHKLEAVEVVNTLIERGYGILATESTERTGARRWNVADPSIVSNPDLARLQRLHQHVVAMSAATSATPLFGVGMSNGARFATRFGQAFADAGLPVGAVAAYMGRVAPGLGQGGLSVPTQFVIAENDTTVPNDQITTEHEATAAAGTPTELLVALEQQLHWMRFLRIPGIEWRDAQATFAALVAAGIWDGDGNRVAALDDLEALAAAVVLPPEVVEYGPEIRDQAMVVLAVHEFRADFAARTADFFDSHHPAED